MRSRLDFEYHIFKSPFIVKDGNLSENATLVYKMDDALREEYDKFTDDMIGKLKTEISVDDMKAYFQSRYQLLNDKLVEGMKEQKLDKRVTHTLEGLRYLFEWGYLILEKFQDEISLVKLGSFFGMKSSGFAKQGLYPHRAYKYQQIISQNNCYFQNTAAHNIATVINQKIQLPYLTNAQIVVSNDTDVIRTRGVEE